MAVAHFTPPYEGEKIGPKSFPAPKTSSLRHWYKAARKVIPELPEWHDWFEKHMEVTLDTIIFADEDYGFLMIARKRHLR
jgi:hypothetical protein